MNDRPAADAAVFFTATAVVWALFMALAGPAFAQERCAPGGYREIVKRLADKWSEGLAGRGMATDGSAVELYVAPTTGTWTVLVIRPDGMICIPAAGKEWKPGEAMKGEPA